MEVEATERGIVDRSWDEDVASFEDEWIVGAFCNGAVDWCQAAYQYAEKEAV